jgi:hypothetical protein
MRIFFAMMIVPLLAAGVGGCTYEHNDYHDRHRRYADGYYRAQRVETHYSYYPRHDGRYYRHGYYRGGDRDCR